MLLLTRLPPLRRVMSVQQCESVPRGDAGTTDTLRAKPPFEGDSEAISIPDCRWQSHLKSNGGLQIVRTTNMVRIRQCLHGNPLYPP